MKKFVLAALLLATACSSSEDLGQGKTGRSVQLSGGTYDQVWNATVKAVREVHGDQSLEVEKSLTIQKEDKATGSIQAFSGMGLLSWGEVVGVWVTPVGEAPVHTVEVESRTKLKTNVFSNNWEDEIIAGVYKNLGMAQPAPTK